MLSVSVALIVAPVVVFTFLLVEEAGNGYDAVNTWVQSGGVKRLPEELAKLPLLGGNRVQHVIQKLAVSQANVEAFLLQSTKALSGFIIEQMTGLVKNAFLLGVDFLVIVITLFFFFKDGKRLLQSLYRVIPLDDAHKEKMFVRLDQTITAVVKGIVITAIVQGLLAGLAYAVLGVPFPVFLTALTIVLAPLPFGGTALVWAPELVCGIASRILFARLRALTATMVRLNRCASSASGTVPSCRSSSCFSASLAAWQPTG